VPKKLKPRIANDGYRVKVRTATKDRVYETVNAKCVMLDPDYNSDIYATFRLIQVAGDKTTGLYGEVDGLKDGEYALTINALGDLRDGCDSTGDVFNPALSVSGYGPGKAAHADPTGDLGTFKSGDYAHGGYGHAPKASIEREAAADLSGTWSIVGRSLVVSTVDVVDSYGTVVTEGGKRLGCCTIGLAAGRPIAKKEEPVYDEPVYYEPTYTKSYAAPAPAYQPYGNHNFGGKY